MIEIRMDLLPSGRPHLDEVICIQGSVHLEAMSETEWCLILTDTSGQSVHVWLASALPIQATWERNV